MSHKTNIPLYLKAHYDKMNALIRGGEIAQAAEYLYSLDRSDYDMIIERAKRGFVFESIINKIESLTTVKKTNQLYKLNSHDGDENFLF